MGLLQFRLYSVFILTFAQSIFTGVSTSFSGILYLVWLCVCVWMCINDYICFTDCYGTLIKVTCVFRLKKEEKKKIYLTGLLSL